ncbi:hypothetical protein, variant [Puccinia triticina 1-1 BBBD Race 1]|nr:hypothetical protein, variant [Puccinia triticina 1-1 BBBD Race 1]
MIDCETGMVHFTGIWKALGHTKADVVKLVESDPTIAPYLRKVRGGYLKIQGTWLPFDTAKTLARRVAWQIRYDLVPLFGPEFPDTCLGPGEPGFGQLLLSAPKPRGRRGAKKNAAASSVAQERTASPQDNRSPSRPGAYPPQESLGNRCSGRLETAGPMNGYGPMLSQPRYSPYTRAPVHRISQLDPLPNLIQPNQSCPHPTTDPTYSSPAHYYHQSPRASMMSSHGTGPYGQQLPTGSTVSGMDSVASLPPMRHYQPHPAENNFFETYRGPDSFEALSNKWLAPELASPAHLNHSGPLNGESSCLSPSQYSNSKNPMGSPANLCSYPNQIDSAHSNHPRDSHQSHQVHNNPGYPRDSMQESNFRHEVPAEEAARHPLSPPQQAATNANYDKPYSLEPPSGSHNANEVVGCHVPLGSNSTGKHAGSPGSNSSLVLKSPTPSSASTSTHMQTSNNHKSNRSPSNTLTNMSNNGGFNSQGEDSMQFSVLTSPAHLETSGGQTENSPPPVHGLDANWNPTQNGALSPNLTTT